MIHMEVIFVIFVFKLTSLNFRQRKIITKREQISLLLKERDDNLVKYIFGLARW